MANHIGKCIDCNTVACVQNSLSSPLEKSEKGGEEGLHYKTVAVSVGVIVVCLFVCLFVCGQKAHGPQLSVKVGHSLTLCFRSHSRHFL